MSAAYVALAAFVLLAGWTSAALWLGGRLSHGERVVLEDQLHDERKGNAEHVEELKRKIKAQAELLAWYRDRYGDDVEGDRVRLEPDALGDAAPADPAA